jgi:ribosome-binding protein aMBF1 (putative translation factor)
MTRMKFERLQRGWNQTTLAFHADHMNAADVSRIETGRLQPYPSQLEKLAKALDVAPDLLLQEIGSVIVGSPSSTPFRAA